MLPSRTMALLAVCLLMSCKDTAPKPRIGTAVSEPLRIGSAAPTLPPTASASSAPAASSAAGTTTAATRRAALGLGPAPPRHPQVCVDRMHEPPTAHVCESDTDCTVCHDGSACGRIVNLDAYAAGGDKCKQRDSAECESSTPRCCAGKCVRSSH